MVYPQPRASSHPIHDLVQGSLPDRPNSEFSILRTRLQALRSSVPQTPEHSLYQAVAPIYDVLKGLDGKDWDRLMETGFGYRQRDESTTYAYSICQTLCLLCRDIRDGKWQDFESRKTDLIKLLIDSNVPRAESLRPPSFNPSAPAFVPPIVTPTSRSAVYQHMNAFPTHSVPLQIGTIDQLSHYIAEIQSVWGEVPANRPLARAALVSLSHLLQELHHDQSFWRRLEQFPNSTTGESSASTICSILDGIIRDSFANENEPYAVRTNLQYGQISSLLRKAGIHLSSSTKQATDFERAQSDNESLSSFNKFKLLCSKLRKVSHALTGRLKHDILQFLNLVEKLELKEYEDEWLKLKSTHPLWISDTSNSRLVNEVFSMLISQAAEGKLHQSIILDSLPEIADTDFSSMRSRLQHLLRKMPSDPNHFLYDALAEVHLVLSKLNEGDWHQLMDSSPDERKGTHRFKTSTYASEACSLLDNLARDVEEEQWDNLAHRLSELKQLLIDANVPQASILLNHSPSPSHQHTIDPHQPSTLHSTRTSYPAFKTPDVPAGFSFEKLDLRIQNLEEIAQNTPKDRPLTHGALRSFICLIKAIDQPMWRKLETTHDRKKEKNLAFTICWIIDGITQSFAQAMNTVYAVRIDFSEDALHVELAPTSALKSRDLLNSLCDELKQKSNAHAEVQRLQGIHNEPSISEYLGLWRFTNQWPTYTNTRPGWTANTSYSAIVNESLSLLIRHLRRDQRPLPIILVRQLHYLIHLTFQSNANL
ncbi:hypothetical protein JCM5353_008011 [Sporobolomyces roseus]